MFPAMAQVVENVITSADYISECKLFVGTATQIFQTILYLLTLLFYLKSFKLLKNNNFY